MKKPTSVDYDPKYMTVAEIKRVVAGLRDIEQLERILRKERGWANRVTAIDVILLHIQELKT